MCRVLASNPIELPTLLYVSVVITDTTCIVDVTIAIIIVTSTSHVYMCSRCYYIYGEKIIMLHVFETITVLFTNPFCSPATSFFAMNEYRCKLMTFIQKLT